MNMEECRIICIIGTRPEAIKMAPVIHLLRKEQWAQCIVVATAQHRKMLDQELSVLGICPDIDLDIMTPDQSLSELTAKLIKRTDDILVEYRPDAVLAQGDTTSVLSVALACYYRNISFGHIEAGLRTGDFKNPFPEEFNRFVSSKVARWHFAPTEHARQNLIGEQIDPDTIYVTGNTVIDALLNAARNDGLSKKPARDDKKVIVVTVHRRESFGEPLKRICHAILRLAEQYDGIRFVTPVHPNPNVASVIHEILGSHPRIELCEPMDYLSFVSLLKASYLIISDSGGLQEEGPALGKPVLVLREKTERPEALEAGVIKLVGTEIEKIVYETQMLIDDPKVYRNLAKGISPYGDGHAAERITAILKRDLYSETGT